MCGIVAVVSKRRYGMSNSAQSIFYQLLYADALRGEDATGVFSANKNGDFAISKAAEQAETFLQDWINSKHDKEAYQDGLVLVGHNRKATIGKPIDQNAHPFVVEDSFVMVHNGTLLNHTRLANTEVDSEALAIHLCKGIRKEENVHKGLETALQEVFGAYAVGFFDQKNAVAGFFRNSERPLGFVETEDMYVVASELGLALWIASRNGEKIKNQFHLAPNTLWLYDMKEPTKEPQTLPFQKPPIHTSVGGTAGTTTGVTKKTKLSLVSDQITDGISKNRAKLISRKLTGQNVTFVPYDYVETQFDRPIMPEDPVLIMGTSVEYGTGVVFRAKVRLDELMITCKEIDSGICPALVGKATLATYNKNDKKLYVTLTDVVSERQANAETVH